VGGRNAGTYRTASLVLGLGLSFAAQAAPEPVPVVFNVRILHEATADIVKSALRGAAERLESPTCQAVFSDFSDLAGRPLQERLESLGQTPQGYLGQIFFYDGAKEPRCQSQDILAVTSPGSHVVHVCPKAIRAMYWRQPLYVEATLIHEALHTLGLGENPPTSREITSQVVKRCRR
jgi:hypothetical protein